MTVPAEASDQQSAETGGHSSGSVAGRAARSTAAVVMIVLGVLCLTLSPVTIWGRNLVLNTDRYVATLEPLARDVGVQDAVIAAVDRQVEEHVDVAAEVEKLLPAAVAQLIGPPLQTATANLVNTVVTRFVRSDAFVTLWVGINRIAHEQLSRILTGEFAPDAIDVSDSGRVTLNLAPVVERVKTELVEAGIGVARSIPAVGATIEVAEVQGLVKAQRAVRLLNTLANWLPWVGLALLVGGIMTARHRRRATIASLLGVCGGMIIMGIGLLIGRHFYLNGVPPTALPRPTAERVFDTLVRYLRDGLRLVLAVALLGALIAWLTGPARRARAIRHWFATVPVAETRKVAQGPVGDFVDQHTRALEAAVAAIGLIILIMINGPGLGAVITIAVLVVAGIVVLELLRLPRVRQHPAV